jgi:hypothetical protein
VVWPQNHWDGFSQFGLKTGGNGFSRFGVKIGVGGFPSLGLKIGSYGLVIWASKSPRWFLVWISKPSGLRFVGCATKPTDGGRHGTRIEILWLASPRSKSR